MGQPAEMACLGLRGEPRWVKARVQELGARSRGPGADRAGWPSAAEEVGKAEPGWPACRAWEMARAERRGGRSSVRAPEREPGARPRGRGESRAAWPPVAWEVGKVGVHC